MRTVLSILAVTAALISTVQSSDYKGHVVCYFSSWAIYRPGSGRYTCKDIPGNVCTHLVYSFAGITDNNKVRVMDPYMDVEMNGYLNFTELCAKRTDRKCMIGMGGWDEDIHRFSRMASQKSSRAEFVDSVLEFMKKFSFEGIDFDWDYPGMIDRNGSAADKDNYLYLMQDFKKAFNKVNKDWEVTASVPLTKKSLDAGYRVPEFCNLLDGIHVVGYDLHGIWNGVTDVHSSLYSRPDEDDKESNVHDGLKLWEKMGCARNKLVVGIPFFGRTYTLAKNSKDDPHAADLGAPIDMNNPYGEPGKYTRTRGYLAYHEICSEIEKSNSGWTMKWDEDAKCPYAYKGRQWVGYENTTSIQIKLEWVKKNKYLGVSVWAVDMDDFQGQCSNKDALMRLVEKHMNNYTVSSVDNGTSTDTSSL